MNGKRFISKIESMYLIEKITYEKWCDNLTISSFFVTDEIINQLKSFFPKSLIF